MRILVIIMTSIKYFRACDGWFWKQTLGLSFAHTSDDHTAAYIHHSLWTFHKVWLLIPDNLLFMWLLVVRWVFCCSFRTCTPRDSHKKPNWCTIKAKFIAHFPKLTWYVQILNPLCTHTSSCYTLGVHWFVLCCRGVLWSPRNKKQV